MTITTLGEPKRMVDEIVYLNLKAWYRVSDILPLIGANTRASSSNVGLRIAR
jgi:hypothetical protein